MPSPGCGSPLLRAPPAPVPAPTPYPIRPDFSPCPIFRSPPLDRSLCHQPGWPVVPCRCPWELPCEEHQLGLYLKMSPGGLGLAWPVSSTPWGGPSAWGTHRAWPVNLDSWVNSKFEFYRECLSQAQEKGESHTGQEAARPRRAASAIDENDAGSGTLGVGEGYKRVERYINAPFTPGSPRVWERRGRRCSVRLCHLPQLSGDQHWRTRCRQRFLGFFLFIFLCGRIRLKMSL